VGNRDYSTPPVAFVYSDGMMHNPNNYLPAAASGWSLSNARDINDYGQIVGGGRNPAGVDGAYLMDTRAVTYSYTSTAKSVSIRDGSTASQSMTLSDNETITDLNVAVKLYHTRYQDLKIELVGPNNVTRVLCNAGALTGSGTKTIVFDDEGAAGTFVPVHPLSNYDGTSTQGKWTVRVSDTVRNRKTGTFYSFTLDVMPELP
jgi:subtilisin-like proprotein convertase family protein